MGPTKQEVEKLFRTTVRELRTQLAESEGKREAAEKRLQNEPRNDDGLLDIHAICDQRDELRERVEAAEQSLQAKRLSNEILRETNGLVTKRAEAAEADCAALQECVKQVKIMLEREKNRQRMAPATDIVMAIEALQVLLAIPNPGANLLAEKKTMEEALAFYGDEKNQWTEKGILYRKEIPTAYYEEAYVGVFYDKGEKARAALPGRKGE